MQKSDVVETFSDTQILSKLINYDPKLLLRKD